MLTDLKAFLITADTSALDPDRAAAIATVRSMVGTGSPVTDGRMFPFGMLDEGATLPALTYVLIDSGVDHTLDGMPDGLYHPRVQIDCWAMTGLAAQQLAEAVRNALDGYTNALMVGTFVGVLLWDNAADFFESDRKQYRRMLDFRVIHN